MIAYLTDGNELFLTQRITDPAELDRLNTQAQECTEGDLWWTAVSPTPYAPDLDSYQAAIFSLLYPQS